MLYYFDFSSPLQEPNGTALKTIVGQPAKDLFEYLANPVFKQGLKAVETFSQLGNAVPIPELQSAIEGLPDAISRAEQLLLDIDQLASRETITPLYSSGKSYLCCNLVESSDDLFDAWTATGCLGLVLALLCSVRIISFVVRNYRLV